VRELLPLILISIVSLYFYTPFNRGSRLAAGVILFLLVSLEIFFYWKYDASGIQTIVRYFKNSFSVEQPLSNEFKAPPKEPLTVKPGLLIPKQRFLGDSTKLTADGILQTINRTGGTNGKILTKYIKKEFNKTLISNNTINSLDYDTAFIIIIIIDDIIVEQSDYDTGSGIIYGVTITPTIIVKIINKNNFITRYEKHYSVTKSYFKDNYSKNKPAKYKELAELLLKKIEVSQLIKVAIN